MDLHSTLLWSHL